MGQAKLSQSGWVCHGSGFKGLELRILMMPPTFFLMSIQEAHHDVQKAPNVSKLSCYNTH
jgi:hypothetical protein